VFGKERKPCRFKDNTVVIYDVAQSRPSSSSSSPWNLNFDTVGHVIDHAFVPEDEGRHTEGNWVLCKKGSIHFAEL
jgi:hypothetical protein